MLVPLALDGSCGPWLVWPTWPARALHGAGNIEESNKRNGLLVEALDGYRDCEGVGASSGISVRRWERAERVARGDFRVRSLTYLANLSQVLQQLTYVGIVAVGSLW